MSKNDMLKVFRLTLVRFLHYIHDKNYNDISDDVLQLGVLFDRWMNE